MIFVRWSIEANKCFILTKLNGFFVTVTLNIVRIVRSDQGVLGRKEVKSTHLILAVIIAYNFLDWLLDFIKSYSCVALVKSIRSLENWGFRAIWHYQLDEIYDVRVLFDNNLGNSVVTRLSLELLLGRPFEGRIVSWFLPNKIEFLQTGIRLVHRTFIKHEYMLLQCCLLVFNQFL